MRKLYRDLLVVRTMIGQHCEVVRATSQSPKVVAGVPNTYGMDLLVANNAIEAITLCAVEASPRIYRLLLGQNKFREESSQTALIIKA